MQHEHWNNRQDGYHRGDRGGHGYRGRGRGGRGYHGGDGGHGYHGGQQHDGQASGMQYLSDEELQTLSQGEPDDVLLSVNDNETKFLNTFKRRHFCHSKRDLKKMIKLLYLLARCDDRSTASRMLAVILCADGEYALFTTKVDQLLKGMVMENRGHIKRENLSCIDQLVDIGLMAIKAIPLTVVSTFPVAVLGETIRDFQLLGENLGFLSGKFEELNSAFSLEKKNLLLKKLKKQKEPFSEESEGEPPEPFTELPILPTREEMHLAPSQVFLRSNRIKKIYNGWDHYFDVQFRLLREDFIRPLREGIEVYTNTGSSSKNTDIRVYEGARVLNPVCLFTGIAFQLRFDCSKLSFVNWEHSRRLIFGSLLCLSNDDFDHCLLFATVVKRDPKLLKEGLVTIKFENDVNGFQIDPKDTYKMVESTAYYEAYRHILQGLQDLSATPDLMPMENYIVSYTIEKSVEVPQFLRLPSKQPRFNMADVLENRIPGVPRRRSLLARKVFDITNHSLWPPAEHTHLDESQLRALEMALTKEVSVIQGPPGTGKTFIGLKIVEAYLKNREVWDPQRSAPILVICYTNHALDQFLEGIHQLSIGAEEDHPKIIRVGGRCKSDALANFVLSKKVQECQRNRLVPRPIFREYMNARSALFDSQRSINSHIEDSDNESKQKITELSTLERVIDDHHIDQMCYGSDTTPGKEVEVWLGLWFPETMEQEVQFPPFQPVHGQAQVLTQIAPEVGKMDDSSSDDDEYIIVDNEARVLEDERRIAGEELEVPLLQGKQAKREKAPKNEPNMAKKSGDGWTTVQLSKAQRMKQISQGFRNEPMTERDAMRVHNIWGLSIKKRWMLYLLWTNRYIKLCKERINERASQYNASCVQYQQSQRRIDCHVAESADVIGMTTTGAAKYHHLLKRIHPKIVIFEEAAEILEAHVITSLASSVQQLIMIGDHKQLRPKPTCYDLEKDYNLHISFFERLLNNGFPHVTLRKQHRMRPEISKLVCPAIYDELLDADNVKEYSNIKGVSKNLFFISHVQPEEANKLNDSKSHVNKYEAEYIVELCHYLLKQGYPPTDITILTMYRGQLLELRKRMKRSQYEGVRVAAVDDFQGEENEIILLSLVRSNSDNSIGFLKIENRVCVSLSRAKKGLYVIGNLSMLKEHHETKWPQILNYLEKEKCVGNGLPLYCPVHLDDKTTARKPGDFRNRPEGGCTKLCGTRLSCGHVCERICHPQDREHKMTNCDKVCSKPLPCNHNCKRKCYHCKKGCGPCLEHVKKYLNCGHTVKLQCGTNPAKTRCPLLCEKLLKCGHQCQNTCSDLCTTHCKHKVKKKLPCGHTVETYCFESADSVVCPVKCEAELSCGDKCSGTCGECQQGRLHVRCKAKCGRDLVCGHPCKYSCASICPPCEEKCGNYCYHSKCPKKCYEPCDPCREPCKWICPHFKCTKPCGEFCNRPACNQPCRKLLKCRHECIGLCGEKCPDKCRICNKDEVCEILFGDEDEDDARFIELQDCKHIIEVKALDNWIFNTDTSKSDDGGTHQVQFKVCPKCKTSIRKSVRYGNIIKETLRDMEAIKQKQADMAGNLKVKYQETVHKIGTASRYVQMELENIYQRIGIPKENSNWYRASAIKFQLSLLPSIAKLQELLEKLKPLTRADIKNCSPAYVKENLSVLTKFVMQEMLSEQQIFDGRSELHRLSCAAKLLDLLSKLQEKGCTMSPSDNRTLLSHLEYVHLSGRKNSDKMSEGKENEISKIIGKMSAKYQVNGLTEKERIEIVNAVGLSKGHWYKCPKGHFYCIGECGGATERSRCPECGSVIGGVNHALAAGNTHAGEMDGSRYAAWSEAANMANFDLAQLRI